MGSSYQVLNRSIRFSGRVQMRSFRSILGDSSAAKPILAVIVVLLLITSTVGAYAVLIAGSPDKGVEAGDKVVVNYIGSFDDGRVFDTSMWSVANDSAIPKSLFFTLRGNETKYAPLEFTVGGYQMITGFDQGVRGMKVGETKQFDVSVAQGYGPMDASLMKTMQLEETIAVKQTMDKAAFQQMFGHDPVTSGVNNANHARLGIEARYHMESNKVVVEFIPQLGKTYQVCSSANAGGWTVKVASIEDGSITVRHQLTDDDGFMVRGYDKAGVQYGKGKLNDFYVDDVNVDAGTFVMNYNPEHKGRVLTFTVTLVSVA